MADVRCPMCGKPNPEELEECRYCGARLKPVVPFDPEKGQPDAAQDNPAPESPGRPDWLSGPGKGGPRDEEIPDWLADLRGSNPSESTPAPATNGEPVQELGNEDWLKRLGGIEPHELAPEPPETANLPTSDLPSSDTLPGSEPESNLPEWLQNLKSLASVIQEPPTASHGGENLPDWLSGIPDATVESHPAPSGTEEPAPPEGGESVPDWLASLGSIPAIPGSTPSEEQPDWLLNLEVKSPPEAVFGSEPSPAIHTADVTPDWLSKLQAEVNVPEAEKPKDDLEIVPETPVSPGKNEPLPDWLEGLGEPLVPSSGTQVFAVADMGTAPSGEGETAFSLEGSDWLSKLNPDQDAEKAAEKKDGQVDSEKLEAAELPSWVQAMRPVESVLESKTTPLDENRVTELSGPLAGLLGVLPAGPGMGVLRKPPAYSSKLQISDGQHRYAASLEKLVAGEADPRAVDAKHFSSNRLWRWLIALLLLLAVGLPFAGGAQIAPVTLLSSSDQGASFKIIDGLPQNIPVLMAFDYDPALSGELEAVAAPLVDHLLSKGTPLALTSTSPTGPALAEHFLQTAPLVREHQNLGGVQVVNLGYLAGGPAGMLYLANALTDAIPVSVDGNSAWTTGPLQGIQSLSNFAAVIILTDNADNGRNWIEQAGSRLGNTPMLMIISAQAEPMIQPYFDSGQLKGLISGMADAAIYEKVFNRPGLAAHYWNSFSVGMLVAELLIAAGAILSVLTNRRVVRVASKKGA